MKQVILSLSFLVGAMTMFAQSTEIEATLTARAQAFADEVFVDCSQFAGSHYVAKYTAKLSRIEIKTEPLSSTEEYIPLSSIGLKNKCNSGLERDMEATFNPEIFNPLKYDLDFNNASDITYRVDNTMYIIVIHP